MPESCVAGLGTNGSEDISWSSSSSIEEGKGTLIKSSISYPSLITEMCRVQGILPPPGVHYGRRTTAITQTEIRDDFVDSPSCFQWHRQHYDPRGCAGWQEPSFAVPEGVDPQPQPRARRQRVPVPPPADTGSFSDVFSRHMDDLSANFEALHWSQREEFDEVHQEIGYV